jgi:hypothetical protein
MSDTFDWTEFRLEEEGHGLVAPCMAFTLWFDVTDGPFLLDFYERTMEALGTRFTHYLAESMKSPAKLTARARTLIPTWLRKPAELKWYFAEFRGAEDIHGASLTVHFRTKSRLTPEQQAASRTNLPIILKQGLLASGLASTVFRVTLPLDHPLAAPEWFAQWVRGFEAVKRGEFITGNCDLSINHDSGWVGKAATTKVQSLCSRYPGLDWFDSGIGLWLRRYEEKTVELLPIAKRAGWITLLNERTVEYLGGEKTLRHMLAGDSTVRVDSLAHGLALQCGEAPQLGNLARAEIPYRSVAAAIRPARLERVRLLGGISQDWVAEWLGMLDAPMPRGQT